MRKQETARKRLFEIITIGTREDSLSRLFDIVLSATIFLNILITILLTFKRFESLFSVFRIVEIVTLSLFCVEYVLRIFTADFLYPEVSRPKAILKFVLSFDGIVDLLTIIPLVSLTGFVAFRLLRVVRILHLFRINANFDSFNVIALVLKDKSKQIISSVIIILIFMLASSLGIYSVEHEAQPDAFQNAFSGIWWSMSALLTVGYGDIYPITVLGKIMGIIVAFLGVGLVAIPTGIISAGFVEHYSFKVQSEKKIPDIRDIGEVFLCPGHESIGKTIAEATKDRTVKVLLIIRGDLQLIPSPSLVLEEGDIAIVESDRIVKKKH